MRFGAGFVVLLLAAGASSASAQYRKFEIIPEVGYTWGGGRSFDAQTVKAGLIPGGKFVLDNSMAYGATFSMESWSGSFFTLTYVRQDSNLGIKWNTTPSAVVVPNPYKKGGFATNQFIIGGRREFAPDAAQLRPYLGAGFGFNVLSPNFGNASSSTDFLLSLNGGLKYMFGTEKRYGLMADFRAAWTYVPSGDWTVYCDYWYGCNTFQTSVAVAQTTLKGGLVIKF